VWAWHAERAREMSHWVDRLAVVFPFEEEIFAAAGVPVSFVGHPLLDDFQPEVSEATLRGELGLGAGPLLGLLPGSRPQEIARHAAILVEAARRLGRDRPEMVAAMALAAGIEPPSGLERGAVRMVRGRTRAIQAYSTACAVASGTATLETALFGTPLAVLYRTGRINYAIARHMVRIPRIGLPNIVAGAEVAPELIQDQLTPGRLEATLAPWLDDPAARAAQSRALAIVRERLGGPGASARAARLLWDLAA